MIEEGNKHLDPLTIFSVIDNFNPIGLGFFNN